MNTDNNIQTKYDPRDVSRNKIKSIIAYTTRVVAMLCASGPLMQTFLSALGFESDLIYIHSSLLQMANILSIVFFSGWANNGNPIKRSAYSILPNAILFLVYVPVAIQKSASLTVYVLLAAVGIAQQISVGLFTVCEYKMPYYIYHKNEYGMILSICGIISSLFSLGSSILISYFTSKFDFTDIMAIAFSVSALLILIAFISIRFEKSLVEEEDKSNDLPQSKRSSLKVLMKDKTFTRLIHANLLRGFAAGLVGVLATVALDLGYTESLTSTMVTAQSIASLGACILFSFTAKKISPRIMLAIGSGIILLLPLLMIRGSGIFLAVFFVITVGRTLIDYAVPSLLIHVVDVKVAGPYHAWRMILQNAGSLIATAIASVVPIPCMLILSAIFQLISGISFIKIANPSK